MTSPPGCILGIDVSAAQGQLDGARIAAAGVRRATVELFVGNDGPNPDAAAQVAELRGAGVVVDGYCFAYPLPADGVHAARDPEAQAALWLAAARALGITRVWVDAEWPQTTAWYTWRVSGDFVRGWLLAAMAALRAGGLDVGLYASPAYLAALGTSKAPELAQAPLWLAYWAQTPCDPPPPWDDWAGWQYTSQGIVDGVTGPVDLSWWRSA